MDLALIILLFPVKKDTACVGGKEWYFYSQRDRKYATGLRTNRATVSGYWKATGKDRPVIRKGTQVGMRKTLVFYQGRAPKGRKTEWVIHEFRLEGATGHGPGPKQDHSIKEQDWVLCRMFYKNMISETPNNQENPNAINGHNRIPNPSSSSSHSLPPLMEPCNNFIFSQTQPYPQQVPCFSNINTQTNPNFPFVTHQESNYTKVLMIPSLEQTVSYPVIHNRPLLDSIVTDNYNTCCDEKVIKEVLSYLTKTESVNDNNPAAINNGSPSFGEGSSESYLSEAGLSSLWNQYS